MCEMVLLWALILVQIQKQVIKLERAEVGNILAERAMEASYFKNGIP